MDRPNTLTNYLGQIKEFKKLSLRRQMFLRNLLADPRRNQTQAALKSGFAKSSAQGQASNLLDNPIIKKILEKHDDLIAADNADLRIKIVRELCLIAFSSLKDFMEWNDKGIEIIDSAKLDDELSKSICEIIHNSTAFGYHKKIKLFDKLRAIAELNKMHGFYAAESIDLTSNGEKMIPASIVVLPSNGREKK